MHEKRSKRSTLYVRRAANLCNHHCIFGVVENMLNCYPSIIHTTAAINLVFNIASYNGYRTVIVNPYTTKLP